MSATPRTSRPWPASFVLALLGALILSPPAARPASAGADAIVNARIVTAPGHVIERGTVVLRDGLITAVGASVPVPADARIWDGDSLTVYPGLIDAFVPAPDQQPGAPAGPAGQRRAPAQPPPRGAGHALATVRPELKLAETLAIPAETLAVLRGSGFAVAHFVPRRGIVRGTSVVAGLSDAGINKSLMRDDAGQVVSIELDPTGYPGSLMGAVAVIRQAFMDAHWYHDVWEAYAKSKAKPRPEANEALAALEPAATGRQPVYFVTHDMLELLRALTIAREAGVTARVVGSGDEYKRAAEIARAGVPLIVPVRFPEAPDIDNPDDAFEVPTEDLRYWNDAPGNPAALARAGVTFALTSNGLRDPKTFRVAVAKAIARGLDRDVALAAVTTVPARLLGLEQHLGAIAPGMAADLTVTRGNLFDETSKVVAVWVDGMRHDATSPEATTPKGNWELAWGHDRARLLVTLDPDTTVKLVVNADTLKAGSPELEGNRLRFDARIGGTSATFDLFARDERLTGAGPAGSRVVGVRLPDPRPGKPREPDPVVSPAVAGNTEPWRMSIPPQPPAVLVKNATVWTAGPQGTVVDADLLVERGKIAKVGAGLIAPKGAVVVDGTGKHVAPGIIDCHSHSAIWGGVNECTNSVTAEVRIRDVINSESVNIYRQLAGGTTVMHLLHGSCNAIGGQCAVIKNKWGEPPDRMLYAPAPQTVKFALGENPKQSNWDERPDPLRYPQSRSGVEQVIRDAFVQARDYGAAWDEWRKGKQPYPPRRDLQRDAVLEILQGKRFIHCHSYRQDEILMLMRLTEEFGCRVQTFQHVLEGYKVADEMAAHGASGSTFSDWWAYKYEVIDAIPYNGYLMWDRGVTVSYNSDGDDLARRLNTEAAKAVKYGGVPPEEAIKFVTINPAKQLKIDAQVGSLEPGKDADFTIWNGSPLSPYSACEQTWIEGRKYFDRAADLAAREALANERAALIARVRAAKKLGGGAGERAAPFRYLAEDGAYSCHEERGEP